MIKYKLSVLVLALAFTIIFSSAAFAQYESNDKSLFGLRLSNYRPSGADLSSLESNWLGPTLDYHLSFDSSDRPVNIISLSILNAGNNQTTAKLASLVATKLKYLGNDSNNPWYIGTGIGVYKTSYEAFDFGRFIQVTDDGLKYGFSLTAGKQFSNVWFSELRYDKIGKLKTSISGDIDFSGITISVGTRMLF